jgi:hypothetical protein
MPNVRSNVSPTDILMQFFSLPLDATAVVVTTLLSAEFNTGLSIRGNYFWYIHRVEWHILMKVLITLGAAWQGVYEMALSARSGLATMPQPEDPGVISYRRLYVDGVVGADSAVYDLSRFDHFLPPVPLATPKLNVYLQGQTGSGVAPTWIAGRKLNCRVGFTTAPLTAQMYDEIAETWSYDTF